VYGVLGDVYLRQDVSHTTHTNAGTYSADTWSFTGTANSNNIAATTITDSIGRATAVVVVTPYTSATLTYDGHAHTATYTITGVNGETGATVGTVDVSHTTHTNAGTYSSDYWTFTGTANYNGIGNTTITDSIAKANATVVVTPYLNVPYDGNAHTAVVTSITGVNGDTGATVGTVDVSHTTHTNAGTYSADTWSFTGTANYNDIAAMTITDEIEKGPSVTTVSGGGSFVYDGNAHPATVSVTGAGLSLAPSPVYSGACAAAPVNVPDTPCMAGYTYAGDANHNGSSGSSTITITRAPQTITWAAPGNIVFGSALSTTQLNASVAGVAGGSAPGALTYTPAAGTTLLVGTQTLRVDAAATINYNAAYKTVTISVLYSTGACLGDLGHTILQPINYDGSSVFQQKSTVPAKFRVCDANGNSIGTAGVVSGFRLVQTVSGTVVSTVDESVVSTTPDTTFRWDPSAQQWIFNMNTKGLSANMTYNYTITLDDGSTINFRFGLK
jgi:hypothetical protein